MVFISYRLHIDMYIVNSVHFDESCQYALLKFEWILTQIPDKCHNDMNQPRSVGLRDPTPQLTLYTEPNKEQTEIKFWVAQKF